MSTRHFLCLVILAALGCATDYSKVRVVDLAKKNEYISQFSVTCKSPVQLTQNCRGLTGPQRIISLDGARILIAGSADGSVIFIADSAVMEVTSNWLKTADQWTEGLNVRYQLVSELLTTKGISILRVVAAVQPPGSATGYFIWCDDDAYATLSEFSL
ncbi:hypothetical protein N8077_05570 [Myxococcota bacterium]|nr:hypothetical protein [Myxococcota bacterium]